MLTKTHSIVTLDPFYNVFTFNFSYHSKSHSMTIMNIWTFEKVVEYNINQTVRSKKSAYFGYMDPFLNVDTLFLTCIYSTFLFSFFMPWVFMYPERKSSLTFPPTCVLSWWKTVTWDCIAYLWYTYQLPASQLALIEINNSKPVSPPHHPGSIKLWDPCKRSVPIKFLDMEEIWILM